MYYNPGDRRIPPAGSIAPLAEVGGGDDDIFLKY